MAVEDFIPVTDVKQTYEKVEKPKPSLAERTTIESPGRPSPADMLDNGGEKKAKKKAVRKKTKKVAPDKISYEGKYTLIITEKPQAAQKIADALGKSRKISDGGVNYFDVSSAKGKIIVASAVGHLFGLTYKAGQKGWPIFELEWVPSYEKKSAAFTKKYYSLLKKLAKGAGEIIVATDYDVEGEVIGWNVLRFVCKRETAKRMKYSTLTKPELEKSYENLMEELDWGQAYAGETRHILDWLYGINLSRALMSAIKTTGSFRLMSIGRVQGPALKIIVDREREIDKFVAEPYWNVFASVDGFEYKHGADIFDKKELDKFKDIKEGVATTKQTEEKIEPPHPFDLTTLQREAYKLHRIGPSQTLSIAQKLYLDGLISYPRTSSQQIPDAIKPREILKALEKQFPEAKKAKRAKPVEGKKTDPAHPSIYPTGEIGKIKEQDKKVYDLIARRFIAAFSADAVTANTRTVIKAKEHDVDFRASGLKVKEKGWTNVYPASMEESEIPIINGDVKIDEIKIVEKETTPPKRFTPTSLITSLEKKNLGTKATRSSIVDTLFDRGYLDGRSIKATPLGMKLIETLEENSPIIIDENLTRQLEVEMEKMQSEKTREGLQEVEDDVIGKARKIIENISKEFKAHEVEIGKGILSGIEVLRKEQNENNTLMLCPTCGKGNLRIMFSRKTRRYFVACSAYPDCKQTYPLPPNSLIKKADKICEDCGNPKLLAIRKGKRPWEFCFNLNCASNAKLKESLDKKREEREAGAKTEDKSSK